MAPTGSLQADNAHIKQPATILVVDDEKIIRELCERALREYRVVQAGCCEEALRVYEKDTIDLILSDVMMPGGSGLDLLKQVKALDPNATVIIMTGFAEKEIILNALKEDADDFINKPLNILQLKTAVDKALGRKALKVELANLKRADRLKSNFLSLISHKLRTPITAISLFLQNIKHGVFDPTDPEFMESVELANDETSYLGRMVADLLEFSQVMVGNDGIKREECDLNEMVADVLQHSIETRSKSGIDVDWNPGNLPTASLDPTKIRFVLRQILDNSLKFSGEVGHISISTLAGVNELCIIVSDSGIGMPREEIPKVFEKFYQIDPNNTGQIQGFGLGLFYAREFVRQHGGGINIDSEPGLGTTVTISLPLQ